MQDEVNRVALGIEKNNFLEQALLKRAMGYWVEEEVKEYTYDYQKDEHGNVQGLVDGASLEKRIVKSKITKHFVPPDLAAIKMLLEQQKDDIGELSEEQLIAERDRLIRILYEETKKSKKGGDKK